MSELRRPRSSTARHPKYCAPSCASPGNATTRRMRNIAVQNVPTMLRPSTAILRHFLLRRQAIARFFQLPSPTWSLNDLNLTTSSEPVTEEELKVLSKRACVDVSNIVDPEGLRRDLANMLHCMEQVKSVKLPDMTAEEVYDAPRGLTAAPVRKASEASPVEVEEAQQVWQSLVQSKLTKHGGHAYFSIDTLKDDKSESNLNRT